MTSAQICRNCGKLFPYDEDADYCPSCAAESTGDDTHSASRHIDVLRREAPHLLAQPDEPRPATIRIVIDTESDEPVLLGTWQEDEPESGEVWYTTSDGDYRKAPGDCVRVVSVQL